MDILFFNTVWMSFNVVLAVIGVVFGWIALYSKSLFFRVLCCIIWFIFVPNTIYIITDLFHLPRQLQFINLQILQILLVMQYCIVVFLGIILFLFGLYPLEKILHIYVKKKKVWIFGIIVFQYIVALGVVLGRIHRTNSWEIFTNPIKVLQELFIVLTTMDQLFLVIIFGTFFSLIYMILRKPIFSAGKQFGRILLNKLGVDY